MLNLEKNDFGNRRYGIIALRQIH